MTDQRNEINEVLNAMNKLLLEGSFSNLAILNAASALSTHLAVMFGINREDYLKDMEIMFDERKGKEPKEPKGTE